MIQCQTIHIVCVKQAVTIHIVACYFGASLQCLMIDERFRMIAHAKRSIERGRNGSVHTDTFRSRIAHA